MRLSRIGLAACIAILTTVVEVPRSFELMANWEVSKVLAQTNEDRKAEAAQLLRQGFQQYQSDRFQAALESFQQALTIFREIKDRFGEGRVLLSLGVVYAESGDKTKGVEYFQQALTIARQFNDPPLEDAVQQALSLVQNQSDPQRAEADRLFQQGFQQFDRSQFQAAIASWQQSLAIYRKTQDRRSEGRALGHLGLAYRFQGDDRQAIEYSQQSLAIAREIGDRKSEGHALGNLGAAYNSLGNYRQAIDYQQQGLAILRQIEDRQGEGHALGNLGLAYYSQGDYRQAIEYYQQSLAILREVGDRDGEGTGLRSLGNAYLDRGNYRQAIEYYQQSLAILREVGDRNSEGAALANLGHAYNSLGNYPQAIEYYQQGLAILREVGDRKSEGQALAGIGNAYNYLGDYRQAIDYYQKGLAIARQIGDRSGEGTALANLGSAYRSLGDYRQAIDYQQQSLAIDRQIGDRKGEGQSLGNLGLAYRFLGDYRQAIEYHQQSLAIAREIGNRKSEGGNLLNLGAVYGILGDHRQEIDYFQQGLAIFREIGDRNGEEAALGGLGTAQDALGEYRKAIEYYQQGLMIARQIGDRQSEGNALINLGGAYNALGDYRQGIDYYQQGLKIFREIGDRNGEGTALVNLGGAYSRLGDYPQVIDYQQQSLAIFRELGDRRGEGAALSNLGLALYEEGNLVAAEKALFEGIEVWESLREILGNDDTNKVSFFEEQARTYRILQRVLIAGNKTDQALEVSERGRARSFVELLKRRLSANPVDILPAKALKPTIEQIKQIAKLQNATLVQYSIIYDEFKIKEKQQSKESELYIWVIKPTGEVIFRKADLKPLWQQQNIALSDLVSTSRKSIGVRGRAAASLEIILQPGTDEKQQLQQLHKLLIAPIADLLPTDPNARVIFVPQRELFLVPFVALQDEQGKYLIEKHTILTSPSIQILELTHQQKQQRRTASNILIAGNPVMPSISLNFGEPATQLSPLQGAEKEAKKIAELFKVQPLLGSQATEATIKAKIANADIIHLATHGLLDYGQVQGKARTGVPGALALTPDNKEDGLLTSDEILDLKLQASLVILSACDTGRGELTSDGVIGLSRAFISAGTPSVIVSLWSIPDAPTADLMNEFYRQLKTNPNKAQALRQAMLVTMKERPHPKDWAAFTLIGEAF